MKEFDYPKHQSKAEVTKALEEGCSDTARAFGEGKYDHLYKEGVEQQPQEQEQYFAQDTPEPHGEVTSLQGDGYMDTPVNEDSAPPEDLSHEDGGQDDNQVEEQDGLKEIDPEMARERELNLIKSESDQKLAELERKLQLTNERLEKEKAEFQKKLAEERKTYSVFDGEEDDSSDTEKKAPQKEAPVGDEHVQSSSIEEMQKKIRQLEAEREYDRALSEYSGFWNGDGKELKPSVEPKYAIDAFRKFYSDSVSSVGNSNLALMGMRDIAYGVKSKQAEKLLGKAGEPPKDFDKIFKSWEVDLYSDGRKINPANGVIEDVNGNSGLSFGESYMLLNKKDPAYSSKKKAVQDVQGQLNKRKQSAKTPDPSEYRPHSTTSRFENPGYSREVLSKARSAGLDYRMNPNTISDPAIRKEYEDMNKFMKSIAR